MKPRKRRKLALTRESLRQLTRAELAAPAGGFEPRSNGECTRTCYTACDIGTSDQDLAP